jgi:sugar lactone lactonase YvrE
MAKNLNLNSRVTAYATLAAVVLGAALWLSRPAFAESTQKWEQRTLEEFESGTAKNVSIRSDGKLMLAPRFRELHDAKAAYLWALVGDSKGNLFAGGGPDAVVYRITPNGQASTFFQTNALEVHALAVDRDDNIYAATSPEAKVYKIKASGESALFFDPKAAYIWDMAFDSKGNLFVATGDQGRIYRVTPQGQDSLFFETEETHARSIRIDADDNLIVGTDPSGLILRVSNTGGNSGQGFVLYQSSKKEITTLALGKDGSIYAAGVGSRSAQPVPVQQPAAPPGSTVQVSASITASSSGSEGQEAQPQAPRPAITPVVGGSEVYRLRPDGEPRVVWSSNSDIVYALALDPNDKLLIGTGDKGRLLRIESDTLYSLVLTTVSSQITALANGAKNQVFAATSNIAKLYRLGPELESEGTFESDIFDAGIFSEWGRVEWNGSEGSPAKIAVSTRSGNLSSPNRNWSPWSEPIDHPEGRVASSPPGRFVQWKAVLSAAGNNSPVLSSVSVYYLPRNVAPAITTTEVTPPNYDFVTANVSATARNLTLPPLSARSSARRTNRGSPARPAQAMREARGFVGIRWQAEDDNRDQLVFRVEIRGQGEENWKLLEEELDREFLSWDSTSFADGVYEARVTVSDAPANPVSEAKTGAQTIAGIVIDNTAPVIQAVRAERAEGRLRVRFEAADQTTKISRAEYSLDGGDWTAIAPVSKLFDSKDLAFDFTTAPVEAGEHTVAVRVFDEHENLAAAKAVVK